MTIASLRKGFPQLFGDGLGIIDAGAREGFHPLFQEMAPLLHLVGFEPDAQECQRLQAQSQKQFDFRSVRYLPYALGAQDHEQALYLCQSPGASALSKPNRVFINRFPNPTRYDLAHTTPVVIRSLNALYREKMLPPCVDILKLDTQGSELNILTGATELLSQQVIAVEVEVLFARLYESQPFFRDVDAFLTTQGFSLFKLRRLEWVRRSFERMPHLSAGQLVFGDALYLRDPLNPELHWQPGNSRQIEALILIALSYDFHDFALELTTVSEYSRGLDVPNVQKAIH